MLALKNRGIKIEYPKAWLPSLMRVVLSAQSADIRTVEALCAALANDDTDAGRVMEKLLAFLPRSIRVDGAIWKADAYWWTDHRINYRKMRRVRKNLMPIVESWKQQAQGAPTWHYRLDPEALVDGMAGVFDFSVSYMRAMIHDENAKSITFDSESDSDSMNQESKTVTEIAFLLRGEGLSAKAAAEFAGMNPLTVRRVIDSVREYDRAGKLKNKAAYLMGALRRELTSFSSANNLTLGTSPQAERGEGDEVFVAGEATNGPAATTNLDEMESLVDEQYQKSWDIAKEQLRLQLDAATFNTWLGDVRVIGVETLAPSPSPSERGKNTTFVLAVRNERALDMCQGRLYKSVRNLLQVSSRQFDADVRFEIARMANHVE